jgi:hypothetical protein
MSAVIQGTETFALILVNRNCDAISQLVKIDHEYD